MNSQNSKLIELENVTVQWGDKPTLNNISFSVCNGDFIAITGPNGGGKTTLLKTILRLISPSIGTVKYFKKLNIGYLPQKNMIDSHFPITLKELVASGLLSSKLSDEEKDIRVGDMLGLVKLENFANNPIGTLSGGQLQRGLLGRAIISDPELIVLDEPLSYIDKHFEADIYNILEDLSKRTTIILVSHEMTTISTMATRHLIVDKTIHECTASHHYVHSDCD